MFFRVFQGLEGLEFKFRSASPASGYPPTRYLFLLFFVFYSVEGGGGGPECLLARTTIAPQKCWDPFCLHNK